MVKNKNYYVVWNTGLAHSINTWQFFMLPTLISKKFSAHFFMCCISFLESEISVSPIDLKMKNLRYKVLVKKKSINSSLDLVGFKCKFSYFCVDLNFALGLFSDEITMVYVTCKIREPLHYSNHVSDKCWSFINHF